MYQNSKNKGIEFLIPNYHLFDVGFYSLIKKTIDKLDISAAIRFDIRNEETANLWLNHNGHEIPQPDSNSHQKFSATHSFFYGFSGSIGVAYQFDEHLFTKLNFSCGFRAPNIAELTANGVHEGTMNYIYGTPSLKAEHSLQLDYALGLNTQHITAEADLFYNEVYNYIFLEKLLSRNGIDSMTDGYSTFQYTSGNAHIYGGEINIDIHPHPLDWLHFENAFSYVQSVQINQPDSSKYLPFTPSPKFTSELRANKKNVGNKLTNAFVKINVEHYFEQDHFFAAFNTETATKSYTLLSVGVGFDIATKSRTKCSFIVTTNNLLDVAYQSHLSRLKYEEMNYLTGRRGVYNIGRNISLKLMIAF
jgi:iron complex outermembrane receptor protein